MIEFKKKRYFIGIWFGDTQATPGDFLATIFRDEGKPWEILLRVRLHMDDETFDSKDIKKWYRSTVGSELSQNEVRRQLEEILSSLPIEAVEFQPIYEDGYEWFLRVQRLKMLPEWVHTRIEKVNGK